MNGIKHFIPTALKCLSSNGTVQNCCFSCLFSWLQLLQQFPLELGDQYFSEGLLLLEGIAQIPVVIVEQ